jgi:hypothetical protein
VGFAAGMDVVRSDKSLKLVGIRIPDRQSHSCSKEYVLKFFYSRRIK